MSSHPLSEFKHFSSQCVNWITKTLAEVWPTVNFFYVGINNYISNVGLTALQLHDAGLNIHGEVLQIHGAWERQSQSERDRDSRPLMSCLCPVSDAVFQSASASISSPELTTRRRLSDDVRAIWMKPISMKRKCKAWNCVKILNSGFHILSFCCSFPPQDKLLCLHYLPLLNLFSFFFFWQPLVSPPNGE